MLTAEQASPARFRRLLGVIGAHRSPGDRPVTDPIIGPSSGMAAGGSQHPMEGPTYAVACRPRVPRQAFLTGQFTFQTALWGHLGNAKADTTTCWGPPQSAAISVERLPLRTVARPRVTDEVANSWRCLPAPVALDRSGKLRNRNAARIDRRERVALAQ